MIGGIQMDQSIVSRARDEPIRTTAINAGELPHFVRPGGQVRYIRLSDLESWATKSFVSM